MELVLGEPADAAPGSQTSEAAEGGADAKAAQGADAGGANNTGGGWLGGTLQSMALHAGLNVCVQVRNIVCKWVQEGQFVASTTCQQLLLETSVADWQQALQVRVPWPTQGAWGCSMLLLWKWCLRMWEQARPCPKDVAPEAIGVWASALRAYVGPGRSLQYSSAAPQKRSRRACYQKNEPNTQHPAFPQNPEAWLCKQLRVTHLTLSLDQHLPSGLGHCYAPLLRTSGISITALLPVFAHLEVRCGRRPACLPACLPALPQQSFLPAFGAPFLGWWLPVGHISHLHPPMLLLGCLCRVLTWQATPSRPRWLWTSSPSMSL